MTTHWVLRMLSHRFGGSKSHTLDPITGRTLCGRFKETEVDHRFAELHKAPTCMKCLKRDARFVVQPVTA